MAHKIDEEKELHGRKTVDRQFAVFRAAAGHRGVFQSQKRELENWNTDEEMKKKKQRREPIFVQRRIQLCNRPLRVILLIQHALSLGRAMLSKRTRRLLGTSASVILVSQHYTKCKQIVGYTTYPHST